MEKQGEPPSYSKLKIATMTVALSLGLSAGADAVDMMHKGEGAKIMHMLRHSPDHERIKSLEGIELFQAANVGVAPNAPTSPITKGAAVAIPVNITSVSGNEPASVQFSLSFNQSDVNILSVSLGSSAASAGKQIQCNTQNSMCIVAGLNANPIQNGQLAVINATVLTTSTDSTSMFSLKGTFAANSSGYFDSSSGGASTLSLGPVTTCSGNLNFALSPNITGPSSSVMAAISGLSNCQGITAFIKSYQGCQIGSTVVPIVSGPTQGNASFTSPGSAGNFGYWACINGLAQEATLQVCSGVPSVSMSPNPAPASTKVTVTANTNNVNNCSGITIVLKDYLGCSAGNTVGTIAFGSSGGSTAITSPGGAGSYGYWACWNGNGSLTTLVVK